MDFVEKTSFTPPDMHGVTVQNQKINTNTMKSYEEIIELAHNKSYDDILEMHRLLIESIRQYISRKLADSGCLIREDIIIDTPEACGISDSMKPCIIKIEESNEGIITFTYEYSDEVEFDYMDTDVLLLVVKELENM